MTTKKAGTAAKGGKLLGGALSEEAVGSSRSVFTGASRSGDGVGLQQYFSPPEVARLIADVIDPGRTLRVLDPTAGAGDLLAPYRVERRYGVEIDSDHTERAPYQALLGDIQKAYGIMRVAQVQFPRVVCNPPFGLTWQHPSIQGNRKMNSTLSCFHIALGLLKPGGVGAMVCGTSRLYRELLAVEAVDRAVFAIVDIEGRVFADADLPTSIIFFCSPEHRTARPRVTLTGTLKTLRDLTQQLQIAMNASVTRIDWGQWGSDPFPDVVKAYAQRHPRSGKPRYDITLHAGQVRVHLGALGRMLSSYSREARLLDLIDHQPPNYFALNSADWETVRELLAEGVVTASPQVLTAVERAIDETRLLLRPMYPVPVQMRLGFLRDLNEIECRRTDLTRGFEAGGKYALDVRSEVTAAKEEKLVEKRDGTSEPRTFEVIRRVLNVTIAGQTFNESPDDIRYLADHFTLPDPGDLAGDHPEELERVKNALRAIEYEFGPADPARGNTGWKIKKFQLEDLARGILKRRAVLAHDPGLGKTAQQLMAAEACWRLGYCRRRLALFVAPQDLHEQWQREALKFLGCTLELIRTPADAARVRRHIRDGGEGWYITHYEALSLVGAKDEQRPTELPVYGPGESRITRRIQTNKALEQRRPEWRARAASEFQKALDAWEEKNRELLNSGDWVAQRRHLRNRPVLAEPMPLPSASLTVEDACPNCLEPAGEHWDGLNCTAVKTWTTRDAHNKLVEHKRGCGYTHRSLRVPTVASILANVFKTGVICVDELSMIRGDYSRRSLAVRGLRAPCRFGASATPIANFINDCFWGLGWTLGFGTPRFPYSYEDGKAKFEADFCVIQYMMGDPEKNEQHLRKNRKVLPEVTNLSMLWRLFSMSIIRRRKEDTGEDLVPNYPKVIEVPAGRAQREMYVAWLRHFTQFFTERNPDHPLVKAGLVDRFAAGIGMLAKMEYATTLPEADPDLDWLLFNTDVDGVSNYTPKLLQALSIIERHVRAGDKVLVGSSLMEMGPLVARLLNARGINAVHITKTNADGSHTTKSPGTRARDVTKFINGDAQVLCAGVQAMKLGHNLDCASVVVLLGLPWSHEAKKQFLDRVHRLTSKRPVTTYMLVTKGTLDQRKLKLLDDKAGASDVALDGRLVEQERERHDWNKTLAEMKKAGLDITGDEVEEAALLAQWERELGSCTPFEPDVTPSGDFSWEDELAAVTPPRRVAAGDWEPTVRIDLSKLRV